MAITQPVISIIVPCYNNAEYLPETLNCVLAQSFTQWECIIINDGSTDNTEVIANTYLAKDDRFIYITQQNGGPSQARNTGIEQAVGEYILPLDADDLIDSTYIEKALNAFRDNKNLTVVYCLANKFGAENHFWDLAEYSYKNLLLKNCIFCSAVYRKSSWLQIGGYNINFRSGLEDWDFWIRLLNPGSQVFQIPAVLFYYRIRETSRNHVIKYTDLEYYREQIYRADAEKYHQQFGEYMKILHDNYALQNQVERLKNSSSYRYGNMLVKPLTYLKKIFSSE